MANTSAYKTAFHSGTVAAHKEDLHKGWIPRQAKKFPCPQCGMSLVLENGKLPIHRAALTNQACK